MRRVVIIATIILFMYLLVPQLLFAQQNGRAFVNGNSTESNAFEPSPQQLNELVEALNCTLSSAEQPFDKLNHYFFDADLASQYIAMLQEKQYPKINQQAAAMFINWSNGVKQLLQSYKGKLSEIKLIQTSQRYGASPDMKIVVAGLHLYFKDGSAEPLRLQLLDFNGYYRILNIEE